MKRGPSRPLGCVRRRSREVPCGPEFRPTDRAKYPSLRRSRRHDWARYRHFLRHSWLSALPLLARLVRPSPPPYSVRSPGTPGRPPTPPRDVVRFLLLRARGSWSYDKVHAIHCALPPSPDPSTGTLSPSVTTTVRERVLNRPPQPLEYCPRVVLSREIRVSSERPPLGGPPFCLSQRVVSHANHSAYCRSRCALGTPTSTRRSWRTSRPRSYGVSMVREEISREIPEPISSLATLLADWKSDPRPRGSGFGQPGVGTAIPVRAGPGRVPIRP